MIWQKRSLLDHWSENYVKFRENKFDKSIVIIQQHQIKTCMRGIPGSLSLHRTGFDPNLQKFLTNSEVFCIQIVNIFCSLQFYLEIKDGVLICG